MNSSLEMVDEALRFFDNYTVDGLYLAGTFLLLLDTYTKRLRVRFMPTYDSQPRSRLEWHRVAVNSYGYQIL